MLLEIRVDDPVLLVILQVLVDNLRVRRGILQVLRVMHYGGNVPATLILELNFPLSCCNTPSPGSFPSGAVITTDEIAIDVPAP